MLAAPCPREAVASPSSPREREEHPTFLKGSWQAEALLPYLGSFHCLVKNTVLVPANLKATQLTLSPTQLSPPTLPFQQKENHTSAHSGDLSPSRHLTLGTAD